MAGKKGNEIQTLEAMADNGHSGAERILSRRPTLYPWLEPVAVAFWRLTRSRNLSGFIPLSEIIAHHGAFPSQYPLSDFARLIYAANDAALVTAKSSGSGTK